MTDVKDWGDITEGDEEAFAKAMPPIKLMLQDVVAMGFCMVPVTPGAMDLRTIVKSIEDEQARPEPRNRRERRRQEKLDRRMRR